MFCPMRKIQLRFFGQFSDRIPQNPTNFLSQGNSFEALKKEMIEKYDFLKDVPFQLAQNQKIGKDNELLEEAEVAVFPPFSGG
jgi:molybdopterin converting factor small subunit